MIDPAPITRYLRAKASSQLLVAATHHLHVFDELNKGPMSIDDLQANLHLQERPAMVLFPALCAMGMTNFTPDGKLGLTELGRFLTLENPANLLGYAGLETEDPGVLNMTSWLRNDGPGDKQQGVSYVKDEAAPSPMDEPEAARFFTMALAGRARYLSPIVADKITHRDGVLLDIACGTGYYSFEWLLANPRSTAILFDRPEVLKVAAELLDDFCSRHGNVAGNIKERLTFLPGDMLEDELSDTDVLLAASLFHDWPTNTCRQLAIKFANALKTGGELWIHDAFLNDTFDGPIAVTDYSAMLFLGTRGRAYSRKEYRNWFNCAGLLTTPAELPTLMDYGLISFVKPA